jgi:hypothetical protein
MRDRDVTRTLLVCGALELFAWVVAWLLDWTLAAVVVAVVVSTAVAGVILEVQRRKGSGPRESDDTRNSP